MIFKKLFTKKDVRAHFSKEENVRIKNPHNAWRGMLKIFFILVAIITLLSGYKYYTVGKSAVEIDTEDTTLAKEPIQIEKLDVILDSFKKKEERTQNYKSTPSVLVDPSR